MEDSPRRSPRGLVRRQIGAPVPLSSSSTSNASGSPTRGAATTKRKSMTTSTATNQGDQRPGKLSRHSVGGERLRKDEYVETEVTISRRNVPGPRKSSIRSAPPQKFESPSNLEVPVVPIKRPLLSSSSLGSTEALGGAELVEMMDLAVAAPPIKEKNRTRKSESSALRNVTTNLTSYGNKKSGERVPQDEPTEVRRQRRVTFNPIQEKTAFERDEPTMRLKPIGEPEPMPPAEDSLSISQTSSSGSSNMDIISGSDSELDSDSDDLESDSESEEEEEVDRALSTEPSVLKVASHADVRRAGPEDDATLGSDMDLTSANMRDSTRQSAYSDDEIHRKDADDDAIDEDDSGSVTMDFTVARGTSSSIGDSPRENTEAVKDESTDAEADTDDDNSMEMTEVFGAIRGSTQQMSLRNSTRLDDEEVETMEFTQPLDELEEESQAEESRSEVSNEESETSSMDLDMDLTGDATGMDMTQHHGRIITSPTKRIVPRMSPSKQPKTVGRLSASPIKRTQATSQRLSSPSKTPQANNVASQGAPQLSSSPRRSRASSRDVSLHLPSPSKQDNYSHLSSPQKPRTTVIHSTFLVSPQRSSRASAPRSPSPPRKGHEYCSKSIEETPPQKMMSEATRKSMARRQSIATPTAKEMSKEVSTPKAKTSAATPHASITKDHPIGSSSDVEVIQSPSRPMKSPTRFRQSLRGGHPSPGYVHSPARRISIPRPKDQDSNNSAFPTPRNYIHSPARRISIPRPLDDPPANTTPREAVSLHFDSAYGASAGSTTAQAAETKLQIPMKDFFEKIDVAFLELDQPVKKPLTAASRDQDQRSERSGAMVQATAGVLPMLDSLLEACEVIKRTVDDGRETAAEHEKNFLAKPPAYVDEFLAITSPSDRANAIASFKVQKSAARARARMSYYGWRADMQFDDGTLQRLRDARVGLEEDLKVLDTGKALVGRFLPNLQERHAALQKQLELERKRKSAIDEGDRAAMTAMHNDVDDVAGILRDYEAEYKNRREELVRVQTKLVEQRDKQKTTRDAIDEAQEAAEAMRDCTESEAERLAREVEQQEMLHGWKLRTLDGGILHLALENRVNVYFEIIPAAGFVKALRLEPAGSCVFDVFDGFTCEALHRAFASNKTSSKRKVNEAIRIVTVAWVRRRQLAWMRDLLLSHFPTDVEIRDDCVCLTSTLLLPRKRSKVLVRIACNASSIVEASEPLFDAASVQVHKIYGSIDIATVQESIRDRLSACDLMTACVETLNAIEGQA